MYERGENKDSAIYYLNKNLEDTKNIAGRGAALLSLYDIEKDLGNYKAASAYLEEHVEILDSMYSTEQYSELQQLINKYNIKIHTARTLDAVADHRRRHVESDFRAVAQRHLGGGDAQPVFVIPEIGIAERQRTAHGQPRPFHQS